MNEQHIKPETSRAGKMSWALMMNPDGLDCDLFISHAWQEGVFEFLMKVIGSWPSSMRHAWCCMLANPQNLNIGALLQSPKDSPFALALEASKLVLVVPNRQRSVYTRLWCAYEAYLAQASGKDIIIARKLISDLDYIFWIYFLTECEMLGDPRCYPNLSKIIIFHFKGQTKIGPGTMFFSKSHTGRVSDLILYTVYPDIT